MHLSFPWQLPEVAVQTKCISGRELTWCRHCGGKGQWACVEPVSWLSTKVTALDGHHPRTPVQVQPHMTHSTGSGR